MRKTCSRGHIFNKTSDCPVCPKCWAGFYRTQVQSDFPASLGAPALRALMNANINNLRQLAKHTEQEVRDLHGMGPTGIAKLKMALKKRKLAFTSPSKTSSGYARHTAKTVDIYIKTAPKEWQPILKKLRETIQATAPDAEESISYGIPSYKWNGPLVYFAVQKHHSTLHAISLNVMKTLKKEIEPFKGTEHALHFTVEHPLPLSLVKKIVKMRLQENAARAKNKKGKI